MKILAVTACPSGLAHTYMAAEALESASRARNIEIKIETQGCLGIDNKINEEDLKGTDFVILTRDMEIQEAERFNGLTILEVNINDVVQKPDEIIEKLQAQLNTPKFYNNRRNLDLTTKDMFSKERVKFNLSGVTKDAVISELIDILIEDGKVIDKNKFKEAVFKREEEFSTGIGMGIAIPHGKSSAVKEASIAFGRSDKGIDFNSMDEKPAYLIFLIAVPEESNDIHLRALSEISRKLMHTDTRKQLFEADSFEKFIKVFE